MTIAFKAILLLRANRLQSISDLTPVRHLTLQSFSSGFARDSGGIQKLVCLAYFGDGASVRASGRNHLPKRVYLSVTLRHPLYGYGLQLFREDFA